MTRTVTMDDSLCKIGKARRQIKKIMTVINMNITYYLILNPNKCAKSENSHYSPILQGCMNTHSGKAKFKNFRILLNGGISSTILMGNMTPKIKLKETVETTW